MTNEGAEELDLKDIGDLETIDFDDESLDLDDFSYDALEGDSDLNADVNGDFKDLPLHSSLEGSVSFDGSLGDELDLDGGLAAEGNREKTLGNALVDTEFGSLSNRDRSDPSVSKSESDGSGDDFVSASKIRQTVDDGTNNLAEDNIDLMDSEALLEDIDIESQSERSESLEIGDMADDAENRDFGEDDPSLVPFEGDDGKSAFAAEDAGEPSLIDASDYGETEFQNVPLDLDGFESETEREEIQTDSMILDASMEIKEASMASLEEKIDSAEVERDEMEGDTGTPGEEPTADDISLEEPELQARGVVETYSPTNVVLSELSGSVVRTESKPDAGKPVSLERQGEESADSVGQDLLLRLPHRLTVEIGRANLKGKDIASLRFGSVIELNERIAEPADLLLDGKVIAKGEVVQINEEKLGVRVTRICV